jgi:hypothetical protein
MKILPALLFVMSCAPTQAAMPSTTTPPTQAAMPSTTTPPTEMLLIMAAAPTPEDYTRGEWGSWRDEDKDCQDTRQEVLNAESQVKPTLDANGCRVLKGQWTDVYTREVFTDPSKIDIDHVVPLKAAYDAGGNTWSADKQKAYFNSLQNPEHLIAVGAFSNRSKGSKTPQEWMPPNEAYHCQYLKDWLTIKDRWGLQVPLEEALFIARGLARKCVAP